MNITLRQLRALVAVSRFESFTTAAELRLCRGKAVESYKIDMMRIAYITKE